MCTQEEASRTPMEMNKYKDTSADGGVESTVVTAIKYLRVHSQLPSTQNVDKLNKLACTPLSG
jgi:hypothetical protein